MMIYLEGWAIESKRMRGLRPIFQVVFERRFALFLSICLRGRATGRERQANQVGGREFYLLAVLMQEHREKIR